MAALFERSEAWLPFDLRIEVFAKRLELTTVPGFVALEKDGDITTDELDRAEKELEKVTHDHVAEIDRMVQTKEQELLSV